MTPRIAIALVAIALATLLSVACGGGSPERPTARVDAAAGQDARTIPGVDASDGKADPDDSAVSAQRDAGVSADSGTRDAAAPDAPDDAAVSEEAGGDAGMDAACSVEGAPGQCITVAACAAMTGYASTPGYCPGPASIECCTNAPSVADNPPPPAGYVLMQQSQVTPAMTTWAVMILDDPTGYPMFSTTTMTFGTQPVLARVEWHPPDFQNSVVHRGVTLYIPD